MVESICHPLLWYVPLVDAAKSYKVVTLILLVVSLQIFLSHILSISPCKRQELFPPHHPSTHPNKLKHSED
jgi:hypothetical protein